LEGLIFQKLAVKNDLSKDKLGLALRIAKWRGIPDDTPLTFNGGVADPVSIEI